MLSTSVHGGIRTCVPYSWIDRIPLDTLTAADVSALLVSLGFANHADAFHGLPMTGADLALIRETDLIDVGMRAPRRRRQLLKLIEPLRADGVPIELVTRGAVTAATPPAPIPLRARRKAVKQQIEASRDARVGPRCRVVHESATQVDARLRAQYAHCLESASAHTREPTATADYPRPCTADAVGPRSAGSGAPGLADVGCTPRPSSANVDAPTPPTAEGDAPGPSTAGIVAPCAAKVDDDKPTDTSVHSTALSRSHLSAKRRPAGHLPDFAALHTTAPHYKETRAAMLRAERVRERVATALEEEAREQSEARVREGRLREANRLVADALHRSGASPSPSLPREAARAEQKKEQRARALQAQAEAREAARQLEERLARRPLLLEGGRIASCGRSARSTAVLTVEQEVVAGVEAVAEVAAVAGEEVVAEPEATVERSVRKATAETAETVEQEVMAPVSPMEDTASAAMQEAASSAELSQSPALKEAHAAGGVPGLDWSAGRDTNAAMMRSIEAAVIAAVAAARVANEAGVSERGAVQDSLRNGLPLVATSDPQRCTLHALCMHSACSTRTARPRRSHPLTVLRQVRSSIRSLARSSYYAAAPDVCDVWVVCTLISMHVLSVHSSRVCCPLEYVHGDAFSMASRFVFCVIAHRGASRSLVRSRSRSLVRPHELIQ